MEARRRIRFLFAFSNCASRSRNCQVELEKSGKELEKSDRLNAVALFQYPNSRHKETIDQG